MSGFPSTLDKAEADSLAPHDCGAVRRYSRRLSDKILAAFHHACDQADLEVAERLLQVLEEMLTKRPTKPTNKRTRDINAFVAGHERLWHLRQTRTNKVL